MSHRVTDNDNIVHRLFLIGGLPGSGKSTLGDIMAHEMDGVLLSTDDYFTDSQGNYSFDPASIGRAHEWNQRRVLEYMDKGTHTIIVANTFTQGWERRPYYDMATLCTYEVFDLMVNTILTDEELAARNVHGVPATTITRMRSRLEICKPW